MTTTVFDAGSTERHSVDRDRSVKLEGPVRVQARGAALWITVDGSPDDTILEPGQLAEFGVADRVLVSAIGAPAVACVTRPAASWRDRWRAWAARQALQA